MGIKNSAKACNTLFTLHTENGFAVLEPFSDDSVNASLSVLETFSSNGFTFGSETVLEPFSFSVNANRFRKRVSSVGISMFLKTRDIIERILTY